MRIIQTKKTTAGAPDPALMQLGQIVINIVDKALYFKKSDGTLVTIKGN